LFLGEALIQMGKNAANGLAVANRLAGEFITNDFHQMIVRNEKARIHLLLIRLTRTVAIASLTEPSNLALYKGKVSIFHQRHC
jgi:hypothetical protein